MFASLLLTQYTQRGELLFPQQTHHTEIQRVSTHLCCCVYSDIVSLLLYAGLLSSSTAEGSRAASRVRTYFTTGVPTLPNSLSLCENCFLYDVPVYSQQHKKLYILFYFLIKKYRYYWYHTAEYIYIVLCVRTYAQPEYFNAGYFFIHSLCTVKLKIFYLYCAIFI